MNRQPNDAVLPPGDRIDRAVEEVTKKPPDLKPSPALTPVLSKDDSSDREDRFRRLEQRIAYLEVELESREDVVQRIEAYHTRMARFEKELEDLRVTLRDFGVQDV